MKITVESTSQCVTLVVAGAEVPARIWEGHTDSGIAVHCYITRIAVHKDSDLSQFEKELKESPQRKPTVAIPLRMII